MGPDVYPPDILAHISLINYINFKSEMFASTVKSAYKEPAYKKSGYNELIYIPQSLPRN